MELLRTKRDMTFNEVHSLSYPFRELKFTSDIFYVAIIPHARDQSSGLGDLWMDRRAEIRKEIEIQAMALEWSLSG